MKNSELLDLYARYKSSGGRLLTQLQQQHGYILTMHVQQQPCPNCATPQNIFAAAGVELDDPRVQQDDPQKLSLRTLGFGRIVQDGPADPVSGKIPQHDVIELPFRCVACRRELQHVVPFVRVAGPGWEWALVPIQLPAQQ